MQWTLHDHGFLPIHDPLIRLTDPAFDGINRLSADLPQLVHNRAFRVKCAGYLTPSLDWDAIAKSKSDAEIERLFVAFSYFASAYVHAPG